MGRSSVEVRQGENLKRLLSRGAIREGGGLPGRRRFPKGFRVRSPWSAARAKQAQGRASAPARAAASASALARRKSMGGEIKDLGLVGATGTKGEILLKPLQGDLRRRQRCFKGFQSHRGRGVSLSLPEGGC